MNIFKLQLNKFTLNKINLKAKRKLFFSSAIHNQFAGLFLSQHLHVDGVVPKQRFHC